MNYRVLEAREQCSEVNRTAHYSLSAVTGRVEPEPTVYVLALWLLSPRSDGVRGIEEGRTLTPASVILSSVTGNRHKLTEFRPTEVNLNFCL